MIIFFFYFVRSYNNNNGFLSMLQKFFQFNENLFVIFTDEGLLGSEIETGGSRLIEGAFNTLVDNLSKISPTYCCSQP